MRELCLTEIDIVSGCKIESYELIYPVAAFSFAITAESTFLGFSGYHFATMTGVISPPLLGCVGLTLLPLAFAFSYAKSTGVL